jgi:glycosyltransferase involved in cell wall biosynthesis
MTCQIYKLSKNIDIFVFFNESPRLFTFIFIKILKKRILWLIPSSYSKMATDPLEFFPLIIYSIGLRLSDRIILYSQNLIDDWGLNKYKNKISIAHRHIVDNMQFFPTVPLQKRENIIGYVGRLSSEKGILNLLNAFLILRNKKIEVTMKIIGDGPLLSKITQFIETNNFQDKIFVKSWVSHNDLPYHYNQFKILVLPSLTEGLPNVVLEAMACGTPVLCNRVGAIPDIIEDKKNGFILTNNSPETISDAIYTILNLNNLENIVINAREKIINDFSPKSAENLWKKILSEENDYFYPKK